MSIQVSHLSHIYSPGMPDEQKALDDISFEIADGEKTCIIGHTGSGKSTLLQHLNGLLRATAGTIRVGDTVITDPGTVMRDVRRRVGLVFQYPEYQLFEETVAKDVAFGPGNLGLSGPQVAQRVRDAIELVGLDYEEIKDVSPFDLSGGQKRRVAIAGVIAMEPEVLILDEPTAGLDPGAHRDIIEMIRHIADSRNATIIFVTHDMTDVADFAEKVLVMDGGRLVMQGGPREVFARRSELAEIGLDVPPAAELMYALRERGLDISTDVLDTAEATEAIAGYIRAREPEGAKC